MSSSEGERVSTTSADREEVVVRFPSLDRLLRAFLPEEAVKHMIAARRERLLAMRAILDNAISRLEEAEKRV